MRSIPLRIRDQVLSSPWRWRIAASPSSKRPWFPWRGSSTYRSSLAARAGFIQFLDELETAAGDLRNDGDASKLRVLVESLERELGEAKLAN